MTTLIAIGTFLICLAAFVVAGIVCAMLLSGRISRKLGE